MSQLCKSRDSPLLVGERCRNITMSTGNVISMVGTRRRAGQSSTAELVSSLEHMLDIYQPKDGELDAESVVMGVPCSYYSVNLGDEERQPLGITLKVFPSSLQLDDIRDAVNRALSELSVTCVEALVLSNPQPWQETTLEQLVPLWRVLEQLHDQQVVQYLGVSDFEQTLFEQMFDSDQIRVRPALIQINLTNCCSVPDDLRDFCRQRDVQILTHNDAQEMLPEELVRSLFHTRLVLPDPDLWKLVWSLRYLVMVQHKGVIKKKGYVVRIARQC